MECRFTELTTKHSTKNSNSIDLYYFNSLRVQDHSGGLYLCTRAAETQSKLYRHSCLCLVFLCKFGCDDLVCFPCHGKRHQSQVNRSHIWFLFLLIICQNWSHWRRVWISASWRTISMIMTTSVTTSIISKSAIVIMSNTQPCCSHCYWDHCYSHLILPN